MPTTPLSGPMNFPPPTEGGGYRSMLGQIAARRHWKIQQFEQPPPQQPAVAPPQAATSPAPPAIQTPVQQPLVAEQSVPSTWPQQLAPGVQLVVNPQQGQPDADPNEKPEWQKTQKEKVDDCKEKLEEAIEGSQEVLATAHTAVPLFSDTFTLDRAKVTFSKLQGIRSAEVTSMRIEDVLNCTADLGMVFGTLKLYNRIANTQPYTIGPFWRSDAIRLKRITHGYVIAIQKEIDVSPLATNELIAMLSKLGEDDHPNAKTGEPTS